VLATANLVGGKATANVLNLIAGTHKIAVSYSGDSNCTVCTSNTLTQKVSQSATTTTLTSSRDVSTHGKTVTLTAAVTVDGAVSGTAGGKVTFMEGKTVLGTATLDGTGAATFSTASLAIGSHTITAVYAGDGNCTKSSGSVLQTVTRAETTVTLVGPTTTPVYGQAAKFTATVTVGGLGGGTAGGKITFCDGATVLGTVVLKKGAASLTVTKLAVGSHTITAIYSGNIYYTSSTAGLTQEIAKSATSVMMKGPSSALVAGQTATFTASVAAVSPGAGTPTGTMYFYDGDVLLGSAKLKKGSATLSTTSLGAGGHTIRAVYAGNANFATGSGELLKGVSQATSKITVKKSANYVAAGNNVTFSITLGTYSPASGVPTGEVTVKEGDTVVGTVTLVGGKTKFVGSFTTRGSHTLTFCYAGDTNFKGVLASVSVKVV
jgi:large repetitive protein